MLKSEINIVYFFILKIKKVGIYIYECLCIYFIKLWRECINDKNIYKYNKENIEKWNISFWVYILIGYSKYLIRNVSVLILGYFWVFFFKVVDVYLIKL